MEHRGCKELNHNIESPEAEEYAFETNQLKMAKLSAHDWLGDVKGVAQNQELVEVRFKNTRKGIFQNVNHLKLQEGDIVAVEASPGHDIGIVSLIGDLVKEKIRKESNPKNQEFKRVYRKAKTVDIHKWKEAVALEKETMLRARRISEDLKLDMKIGDVEYQGDKTKAIFYYIADERVDFRELIKVLAEQFRIRIEMRQIGARQEAGRIGGIGACGRELCCSTFITNFVSVTTNAARIQEVSLNPQKLAGQCSKLKCCLNYEVDAYMDARKDFPDTNKPLEIMSGNFFHQKTDIFKGVMWYSSDPELAVNLTAVPVKRVQEILRMNTKGKKPDVLVEISEAALEEALGFKNVVGQEDIDRFENKQKKPKRNKKRRKPQGQKPQGQSNRPSNQKQQDQKPKQEHKPKQDRNGKSEGGEKKQAGGNKKPYNRGNRKRSQQQKDGAQQTGGNNQQKSPQGNKNRPSKNHSNKPRKRPNNENNDK